MGWDKSVYVEVATNYAYSVLIWPLLVSYGLFITVLTSSVHQGSPRTSLKV